MTFKMFPDSPDLLCYLSLQGPFVYASLWKLSKIAKYFKLYLLTMGKVFHIILYFTE